MIKSLEKVKCCIRKYSLNVKVSHEGGIEEQKLHEPQKTKPKMADVNLTISRIE